MKHLAKASIWASLALSPLIMQAQNHGGTYDPSLEPSKSFHQARKLIEEGRFEDAHTIHQKMFSDVGSFRPKVFFLSVYNLTYDWHRSAQKHPPAMKSMLKLRDTLEERLSQLRGEGQDPSMKDRIDLLTVFSFNEWLNNDAKSAELFATIEAQYPSLADKMYFHCKDALIRAKRYPTIVRYEPDPKLIFSSAAEIFKITIDVRPDFKVRAEKDFESAVLSSFDAFSAIGEKAKAEELRPRGQNQLRHQSLMAARKMKPINELLSLS